MTARLKRYCISLTLFLVIIIPISVAGQEVDLNNAVIDGKVIAPTGRPVDKNIKIVLRNDQIALNTFYTDKNGEFRMVGLSQGIYYLQALPDPETYDPVEVRVDVPKGKEVHVSMPLRLKNNTTTKTTGSKVISASELNENVPGPARKEFDKATKLSGQGKTQEAVTHLKQAIAIYPTYVAAWNSLGVQYLRLKQYDEAVNCLKKALEKDPKYFDAVFNLGLVMIEQGKYQDAATQLNQAIDIDGTKAAAHLWLGFALLQTNALPDAERELSKALIESDSTYIVAHFYLAQLYIKRDDLAGAQRELKLYLEKPPDGEYSVEAQRLLKMVESKLKSRP